MLQVITEAGVDIYSGAYIKTIVNEEYSKEGKETTDITKKCDIEVVYSLKGISVDKIKAAEIVGMVTGVTTPDPIIENTTKQLVELIEGMRDPMQQYLAAKRYKDDLEKRMTAIRKDLWLHKMAMYKLGNGVMHTHDRKIWEEVKTRKADSKQFKSIDGATEGLIVTVTGIDM